MPAAVDAQTHPAAARRHAFGQPIRLWMYVLAVLAGGLAVVFGPLHHAPAISASSVPAIPWWGIILLATAAELASVELPIRRTNVVLTLNDAVIIVALMGTSPFVTALAMALSLGSSRPPRSARPCR